MCEENFATNAPGRIAVTEWGFGVFSTNAPRRIAVTEWDFGVFQYE